MTIDVPDIIRDKLAAFTPAELEVLRSRLTDPLFVKLLSVAENGKPSAFCQGAGSGPRDAFSNDRANAKLGEIRGWELHQAAIFATLYPQPKREETPINYQPVQKEGEVPDKPETD